MTYLSWGTLESSRIMGKLKKLIIFDYPYVVTMQRFFFKVTFVVSS